MAIHSIRVARKGGKVICANCGTRVEPGTAYVHVNKKSYCVCCEGPGKAIWNSCEGEDSL